MISSFLKSIAHEVRYLRNAPGMLALTTIVPLLAAAVFLWIYSSGIPTQLPLVIADADQSSLSRQLVRMMLAVRSSQVVECTGSFEEAKAAVRKREAYVAMHIPENFERDVLRGQTTQVYAFFNDCYYSPGGLISRDVSNAVSQLNANLAASHKGSNRVVNGTSPSGAPMAIQATVLFAPTGSYERTLVPVIALGILMIAMSAVVINSMVREMGPTRRQQWLANAGGVAMGIIAKVSFYALIFTTYGCWMLFVWLRFRGYPANGSMTLMMFALFLMFLGYGFVMTLIAGLSKGHLLSAISTASAYMSSALMFGDIIFPINTSSWFVKFMNEIMPFSSYIQLQVQQYDAGATFTESLWYLCKLGNFALIAFLLGFLLVRSVVRKGKVEHARPKMTPFDADGSAGTGFMRGVRMVFWTIKNEKGIATALVAGTLLYSFYYPSAYSEQVAWNLPVAVVDADNSAQSREFVRKISMMRSIELVARPNTLAEAQHLINTREADGVVYIAPNFGRDAIAGHAGQVALFSNGGYLVRNSAIMGALAEVAQVEALSLMEPQLLKAGVAGPMLEAAAMPVRTVSRPLYNTREGYGSFVVTAAAQLIVQQTLFLGVVMVMGRRRQRALQSVQDLPGMSGSEFFGMFVTFMLIGLANAYWINGFGFWIQDYPRGGNIWGLLLFTPPFIAAATGIAMLIGSFVINTERASQYLVCSSLFVFFLAGVSWPEESLPTFLKWIGQLVPSTPGISGYVKLNQMGASMHDCTREFVQLLILAVLSTALAWMRLGRDAPYQQRDVVVQKA